MISGLLPRAARYCGQTTSYIDQMVPTAKSAAIGTTMPRRRHQRNRSFVDHALVARAARVSGTRSIGPMPMNIDSPVIAEDRRVAPERGRSTDERTDEQPDHLVRLQLRKPLRALRPERSDR